MVVDALESLPQPLKNILNTHSNAHVKRHSQPFVVRVCLSVSQFDIKLTPPLLSAVDLPYCLHAVCTLHPHPAQSVLRVYTARGRHTVHVLSVSLLPALLNLWTPDQQTLH